MSAVLTLRSPPEPGRTIELKPGINRVGRHPDNDISIPDPSISSFHCEISVAEISVAVKDLGSTNGTFLNQQPIAKGILKNSDLLTLGSVDLAVAISEVHIGLPEIPVFEAPHAEFLEDGRPACLHHHEIPATQRCTKCDNWFCDECVRRMKRLNAGYLLFCPECSAPVEALLQETAAQKRSFLDRLGDTLRITRKKP